MIQWENTTPPAPPYIASIFNYYLSEELEGYEEYDVLTIALAKNSSGFLGYESFKHNGRGSFISYWKDMESVRAWAQHPIHIEAKKFGAQKWYRYYHSAIAEVHSMRTNTL